MKVKFSVIFLSNCFLNNENNNLLNTPQIDIEPCYGLVAKVSASTQESGVMGFSQTQVDTLFPHMTSVTGNGHKSDLYKL